MSDPNAKIPPELDIKSEKLIHYPKCIHQLTCKGKCLDCDSYEPIDDVEEIED